MSDTRNDLEKTLNIDDVLIANQDDFHCSTIGVVMTTRSFIITASPASYYSLGK